MVDSLKKYYTNHYFIIVLLYCIANFFILLNKGIFIDDWVIYNNSSAGIKEIFTGVGLWNTGIGYLHIYISGLGNAILIYHLIIFVSYLIICVLFYYTLTFFDFFNTHQRLAIVLLFISLPYNSARITINCLHYALSLLAFMLAYCFFLYNCRIKSTIVIRLASVFLFLVSFITNSFVFFYLIIPFTIVYFNYQPSQPLSFYFKPLKRYLDFIMLPFLFYVIKFFWLQSSGIYKDSAYNAIDFLRIVKTPYNLFKSFSESLLGISKILPPDFYLWIVPLILFTHYVIIKKNSNQELLNTRDNKKMFYSGLTLFLLACIPYCLVDKPTSFYGYYDSRHQLIIGFGSSIIVLSGFCIFQTKYKALLLSIVISIFILCQTNVYLEYQFDAYRQESFLRKISHDSVFQERGMIKLKNEMQQENTLEWRFYVFAGMIKKVYGTQHTLIIKEIDYEQINEKIKGGIEVFAREQYNLKNFKKDKFNAILYLEDGKIHYTIFNTLSLMFYEYFNRVKFDKVLPELMEYRFVDEEVLSD